MKKWYVYNGLLSCHKKGGNPAICSYCTWMGHECISLSVVNGERQILCDFTIMWKLLKTNPPHRQNRWVVAREGFGQKWVRVDKDTNFHL